MMLEFEWSMKKGVGVRDHLDKLHLMEILNRFLDELLREKDHSADVRFM